MVSARFDAKENPVGKNDNRRTLKMRRRRAQSKLKARAKRRIEAAQASKPAAPAKKK